MQVNNEKLEIDIRLAQTTALASIRTTVEALIELITNVDDSYERISIKTNEKNYKHKPCIINYKLGGNNEPSYLEILDRAEGQTYEELKRNLVMGRYASNESSRGFWGRGLKDVSVHGVVTLKTIKNNKYTEVTFSLNDGSKDFKYKDQVPSPSQFKDLGLKKNKNGTKVEFTINKGSITHSYYETCVKNLQAHFMLKNIMHEQNGTLKIVMKDMNKKNEQNTLAYRPPKFKKTIFNDYITSQQIEEYNKFYKTQHKVHFQLYEIEEDEAAISDTSICGIFIEGTKQVFCKDFFNIQSQRTNNNFKKIYGILKTPLLDETLKTFRDGPNTDNLRLNPTPLYEPSRRVGVNWDHPLIKKIIKQPKLILENYMKSLEEKSESLSFNNSAKKILNEITNLIADEMKDVDSELSNFDKGKIDKLKVGQWYALPKLINLHPDEEKTIYVYTHKDTLENFDEELILNIKEQDKYYLDCTNIKCKPIKTNSEEKYRFAFDLKAVKPKNNIELSFFYKTDTSKKTELTININDYQDRLFATPLEFEHSNYSVKYLGKRLIKVFHKYNVGDPIKKEINYISENENIVSCSGKTVTLTRFHQTNYLVGEFEVKGEFFGEQTRLLAETDETSISCTVHVVNKQENNKHDYDIQLSTEGNVRYYWGFNESDLNTLYLCKNHLSFKYTFDKESDIKSIISTKEGRVFYCELIADAVADKKIKSLIDKSPVEEFNNQLILVSERMTIIKNNFIEKLYKSLFK